MNSLIDIFSIGIKMLAVFSAHLIVYLISGYAFVVLFLKKNKFNFYTSLFVGFPIASVLAAFFTFYLRTSFVFSLCILVTASISIIFYKIHFMRSSHSGHEYGGLDAYNNVQIPMSIFALTVLMSVLHNLPYIRGALELPADNYNVYFTSTDPDLEGHARTLLSIMVYGLPAQIASAPGVPLIYQTGFLHVPAGIASFLPVNATQAYSAQRIIGSFVYFWIIYACIYTMFKNKDKALIGFIIFFAFGYYAKITWSPHQCVSIAYSLLLIAFFSEKSIYEKNNRQHYLHILVIAYIVQSSIIVGLIFCISIAVFMLYRFATSGKKLDYIKDNYIRLTVSAIVLLALLIPVYWSAIVNHDSNRMIVKEEIILFNFGNFASNVRLLRNHFGNYALITVLIICAARLAQRKNTLLIIYLFVSIAILLPIKRDWWLLKGITLLAMQPPYPAFQFWIELQYKCLFIVEILGPFIAVAYLDHLNIRNKRIKILTEAALYLFLLYGQLHLMKEIYTHHYLKTPVVTKEFSEMTHWIRKNTTLDDAVTVYDYDRTLFDFRLNRKGVASGKNIFCRREYLSTIVKYSEKYYHDNKSNLAGLLKSKYIFVPDSQTGVIARSFKDSFLIDMDFPKNSKRSREIIEMLGFKKRYENGSGAVYENKGKYTKKEMQYILKRAAIF